MDHDHSLVSYGPMPVFLHPRGYMTDACQSYRPGAMGSTNFWPYISEFSYFRPPMFHRNLTGFQDDMAVSNNSYIRGPARGHLIHTSAFHNPEIFGGSSFRVGYKDNRYPIFQSNVQTRGVYSLNEGHPFTEFFFFHWLPTNTNSSVHSEGIVDAYSYPVYMGGFAWTRTINEKFPGTHPGANLSHSSVFPMANGCFPQNFPTLYNTFESKDAVGNARYVSQDPHRGYDASNITAPKTFYGSGQDVLPNKNNFRLREMDLSCTAGRKKPTDRNSSQKQDHYKDRVETNQVKSPTVSSKSRAFRNTGSVKHSGQQDNAQRNKSTQTIKGPAPTSKIGNEKASAPHQVWREKAVVQPSASRARQPCASQAKQSRTRKNTTPIYHITWDGVDESCEPVGQDCQLCNEDLTYAPTDIEFEYYDALDGPSKLPEVSVLSCGHAFHSQCLQFITPDEQSTDRPCYLCSSGKS